MFLHLKIAKGGLQTTVGNKRDAFVERGYSETQCHRMTGTHFKFFASSSVFLGCKLYTLWIENMLKVSCILVM